ncbi:MAG TPA: ABC transporter ATP-binding protein [Spirochaetota bacterium]|nr:ABC transporter ATP-binding protein [Spirochaetota bacterium]HPR47738.1 ABC transporter ATP-binding protein [Spirochaetota bacterium]
MEKIYGYGHSALKVLRGVSLSVSRGDVVSIVGPSGAGKSTLLNCMGCLDGFQKGTMRLMGRDVSRMTLDELSGFRNRHLGFIFQLHNLLPEFTAVENVMIPLLIRRMNRIDARKKALAVLERFNLSDRLFHRPSELSGGECQRIAVARAIVGEPDIVLADEPTGSLDTENSRNLASTLLQMGREKNTTIIIVTHDFEIAGMTERKISLVDGEIVNDIMLRNNGTEH